MAEAGREAGPCDGGFLTLPGGEACDHSAAATALPANTEPACRPPWPECGAGAVSRASGLADVLVPEFGA